MLFILFLYSCTILFVRVSITKVNRISILRIHLFPERLKFIYRSLYQNETKCIDFRGIKFIIIIIIIISYVSCLQLYIYFFSLSYPTAAFSLHPDAVMFFLVSNELTPYKIKSNRGSVCLEMNTRSLM